MSVETPFFHFIKKNCYIYIYISNLPTRGGCIPTGSLFCSSCGFKIRFSQMFTTLFALAQ